jgi:hypothetical protein
MAGAGAGSGNASIKPTVIWGGWLGADFAFETKRSSASNRLEGPVGSASHGSIVLPRSGVPAARTVRGGVVSAGRDIF